MNFELSDSQSMLYDLVERLASEEHGFGVRNEAIRSAAGWNAEFWAQLAELGIFGAALPDDAGGLGGDGIDIMLIAKALGKNLVIGPYIPTIVCAAALIVRCGTAEQVAKYLPPILAGADVIAFACFEDDSFGAVEKIGATATRSDAGYILAGRKSLVLGGAWASQYLVVARLDGASELAAFLVPSDAPELEAVHLQTIDGGRATQLRFDDVIIPAGNRLGSEGDLLEPILQVVDEAIVALCAEACGSAAAIVDATIDYAKTRQQFGRPIGSNQSIGHRIVDMSIASERLDAITHRAALSLGWNAGERQRAVSAAKVTAGCLGRWIGQAAVQIHGGIGVTEELAVTHHFRRIEVLDKLFGAAEDHLVRYANLIGEPGSVA